MIDVRSMIENKEFQEQVCRTSAPIVVFWATMNVIQRSAGVIGYYSGRRGSLILGSVAVAVGSVVGNHICTRTIFPSLCCTRHTTTTTTTTTGWGWFSSNKPKGRISDQPIDSNDHTRGLAVCRTALTVVLYSGLSLNWCQTVFPSSVITIGGYAKGRNLPYTLSGAVPSTSAVATLNERIAVNKKGDIFGCHHCGSRQLFSKQRFIADHMPPTKMANEMNETFWRKWLNIKVRQDLWPQCQSCFQMQGSAVRVNEHRLVYTPGLRVHHLSLLLAMLLSEYVIETEVYTGFVESVTALSGRVRKVLDEVSAGR